MPGKFDWAVPIAKFATSLSNAPSEELTSKPPTRYLQLVSSSQEDGIFSLYDGNTNLHESDARLGFKQDSLFALQRSHPSKMMRLQLKDGVVVFLQMKSDGDARSVEGKMLATDDGHRKGDIDFRLVDRYVNALYQSPLITKSNLLFSVEMSMSYSRDIVHRRHRAS